MIAAFPSQSVWPFEAIVIYVFLIFCVSYAVRPANIKSPITEIANVIADEAIQMFKIEATIRPITPIIKKLPQPEISRFVVYPYNESPPNAIAVVKNVCVIDMPVYTANIHDIDKPINAEKIINDNLAAV